ncbi:hypothetical protein PHYBOEH_003049 [Phytophthora boehmeriae]|uniref:SET domain-containing protein n=1 Tax=Phytophthora boehmeriae TaxID=109152 RepID=A0A8T1WTF1_9STRA|nr:hypothetical protein PHYBOEH_003049 [Phytophthora boehmeriae]
MKKLCVKRENFPAAVEVVFAAHRDLWRLYGVGSLLSLVCVCKKTREAILAWTEAVLVDISLGKEDLPVPVQLSAQNPRSKLRKIVELMDFTYLTATKLPFINDQHKLPADVQAKQQSDEFCRRVLCGRQVQVVVAECPGKGWGVLAAQEIGQGECVGEYTGELISSREMQRRYRDLYDSEAKNYVLSLREHVARQGLEFDVVRTNVDASSGGNLTRFINHSCSPNLEVAAVRVDSYIPRLALFAQTRIQRGQELTFDYGEGSDPSNANTNGNQRGRRCRCGARQCRGYLPTSA